MQLYMRSDQTVAFRVAMVMEDDSIVMFEAGESSLCKLLEPRAMTSRCQYHMILFIYFVCLFSLTQ